MQPKSFPNRNRIVIVLVHEMVCVYARMPYKSREVSMPRIVAWPTWEPFVERDVVSTIRTTAFGITRRPVW